MWRFLKKLKIELPYDPAIALLGIYPKDTDGVKRRAICTPNAYSSNGHGHQTVERTKMPFNGRMDKVDVVHIHYGVLCLHQKGLIPNFYSNMDWTGSEVTQAERVKYHMVSLTSGA